MAEGARYVPAAGRTVFTGLYDPVMALTMREGAMMIGLLYKDLYGSDLLLSFSSTWS